MRAQPQSKHGDDTFPSRPITIVFLRPQCYHRLRVRGRQKQALCLHSKGYNQHLPSTDSEQVKYCNFLNPHENEGDTLPHPSSTDEISLTAVFKSDNALRTKACACTKIWVDRSGTKDNCRAVGHSVSGRSPATEWITSEIDTVLQPRKDHKQRNR